MYFAIHTEFSNFPRTLLFFFRKDQVNLEVFKVVKEISAVNHVRRCQTVKRFKGFRTKK
jgi:hypothetical protein